MNERYLPLLLASLISSPQRSCDAFSKVLMSPTTTKQNLKKLLISKSICMTRKPPGPGERYIEPLLLLQEADAGGAGPHTGDHDDVPLSALEPVHSVHCHLWRKGHRYHEEKY